MQSCSSLGGLYQFGDGIKKDEAHAAAIYEKACLAGDGLCCNNLGTLLPHLQSGALRGLMTTTTARLPEAPEIPTARELGWPDMEKLAAWSALMGPPGLPKTVVDRWTEVLGGLAKDSAWLEGTRRIGGIPSIRSPEETEKFVREQYALYENLAQRLDLKQ